MKVTLLVVGRIKAPHAEADAHYRKLLSRYLDLQVIEARDDRELLRRLPDRGHVAALDVGGRSMSSEDWRAWLEQRRLAALDLCLLIGGAEGLPGAALDASRERLSLGPQTLPHQLARVVLVEQLYRAAKIAAGEPYHYG